MTVLRGTALLVVLLLAYLAGLEGRRALFQVEGPPSFYLEKDQGIRVDLGEGFPAPGVHQFSDGTTPADVIKMTGLVLPADSGLLAAPLRSGEALGLSRMGREVVDVKRCWMSSGQRMALGIALHPDRMSRSDWEALPGIGPELARVIDDDRQKNGDFETFDRLDRVRGIGPGRLKAWAKYFE